MHQNILTQFIILLQIYDTRIGQLSHFSQYYIFLHVNGVLEKPLPRIIGATCDMHRMQHFARIADLLSKQVCPITEKH